MAESTVCPVSGGVCSTGIAMQEVEQVAQSIDRTPVSQQRLQKLGEAAVGQGHRGSARRGPLNKRKHECGGMTEKALQQRRREGCPDEAFGDWRLRGAKGVEIGVGLPLLEQQFHLPAKPVQGRDRLRIEFITVQVGDQDDVLLGLGIPQRYEPKHDQSSSRSLPTNLEVCRPLPDRHQDLLQRQRFKLAPSAALDVAAVDHGVYVPFVSNDEAAAGLIHLVTVVDVAITTVGKKQLSFEADWCRQEGSLSLDVRCQSNPHNLIAKHAHGRVQFDGRRTDRVEPARKFDLQAVVNGEGRSILNEDVRKAVQCVSRDRRQDLHGGLPQDVLEDAFHEAGEFILRQLVVERLVLHVGPSQSIEATQDISDRLNALAGQSANHGDGEPMRRHFPQPFGEARFAAELRKRLLFQRLPKLPSGSGKLGGVQRVLHGCCLFDTYNLPWNPVELTQHIANKALIRSSLCVGTRIFIHTPGKWIAGLARKVGFA